MRIQTLSSSKCSTQATVQLQPIELNSELKSKRGFKPRPRLGPPATRYLATPLLRYDSLAVAGLAAAGCWLLALVDDHRRI
jgi:hypothetical protein